MWQATPTPTMPVTVNTTAPVDALHRFLQKHKAERGNPYTHTSLGIPHGAYYIPHVESEEFFRLYGAAVATGAPLHLTEKHKMLGPVCIDLDFRHLEHDGARVYTRDQIKRIIDIYVEELRRYVKLPTSPAARAYVMEKPEPRVVGDLLKDGVHVLIPDVVTTPMVQQKVRDLALPLIEPILNELKCKEGPATVFDESVIERNGWMMYGSRKQDDTPYAVTAVVTYGPTGEGVMEAVTAPFDEAFTRLFSLRNKLALSPLVESKRFEVDAMEDAHMREVIKATPRLEQYLSGGGDSSSCQSEAGAAPPRMGSKAPRRHEEIDMSVVRQLVGMLDGTKRANNYYDWIRVGFCLHHIDHQEGLAIWDEFSKASDKYRPGDCERYWRSMRANGGLGMGTLHMWAKNDNPTAYATLTRNTLRDLIMQSMTGTHHDIARVLFQMYRHDFVCSSIRYRTWWEFRGHRWMQSDSGTTLRQRISVELWREFAAVSVLCQQAALDSQLPCDQDRLLSQAKKLTELALELKRTNFKDNIMKEAGELFYCEDFENKLDAHTGLIGFENGVYDLDNKEFRAGRPDDFISFSTQNDYVPYDASHPYAIGLLAYLAQVFTEEAVREYVLKVCASFLHGSTRDQKFHIWTGVGSNSKSLYVTLFEKAFGDYCIKFPITLLTQKRAASNAATPEVARSRGKRFASLQEPSEDEKLNIGLMKELSGGDRIQARGLFKEPVEFYPQFKMLLLCNHLPSVPSEDGGTWRRIRVVEFTSRFCDNPRRELNEFPIDHDLQDKLNGWREHFMALLIHYFERYQAYGVEEPEAVLKVTREYRESNDHIARFASEHLVKEADQTVFVCVDEVLQEYQDWAKRENIPHFKPPKRMDFDKAIGRVFNLKSVNKKGGGKQFKGMRLIRAGEEQGDGEGSD